MQLAALKKAGCQTVFKDEGISGATTKRPALLRCLKKLESGDALIVRKLDRLGRSLRDLITMLDDQKHRGVKFRSLTEAIDTETPTGRAIRLFRGASGSFARNCAGPAAAANGNDASRTPGLVPAPERYDEGSSAWHLYLMAFLRAEVYLLQLRVRRFSAGA